MKSTSVAVVGVLSLATAWSVVATIGSSQAQDAVFEAPKAEYRAVISPSEVEFRLSELERKVKGMQKQITILHAKVNSVNDRCPCKPKAAACSSGR
jgi:peptidoglycan hydrolase CwlO-like protein